jgi:hypothetical protein
MQRLVGVWCVAAVLGGGAVRGDEETEVRAVLDRAIDAHGGAEKLARYTAATMKIRGRLHNGRGETCDFTGLTAAVPRKLRVEINLTVLGRDCKAVQVLNGNQGWVAQNDQVRPMSKEQLEEEQEHLYAGVVSHLVALRDKRYRLAWLGEGNVHGRDAVGLCVRRRGRRDVNLYFDKATGLLLRTECLVKDLDSGGREFVVETLYDDYRPVDGVQVAHRFTIRRDGRLYVQSQAVEVKVGEKLDDRLFDKPGGGE